jgi:hypothetical protein
LDVIWLCRDCHVAHHKKGRACEALTTN